MEKFIIYQVLPRLFGNTNENCVPNSSFITNQSGKFKDFDLKTLKSIKDLGCTHIWFTGVLEHATKTDYSNYGIPKDNPLLVKGEAGSPYAIKDYFDVDPDLAENVLCRIEEFSELIYRCHSLSLKVIIDFVPNHVARCYHSDKSPLFACDFGINDKRDYSFHPMNNFYYILNENFILPVSNSDGSSCYNEFPARVTGNDCFLPDPDIDDWYETVKLNYGIDYQDRNKTYFNPVPDTWKKMRVILQYWVDFGVDGFRCDMAEMVPVDFWKWVIKSIKKTNPETLFIGEVYKPELYTEYLNKGGFDYLYDKVGLYENLKNILLGNSPASSVTQSWQSLGSNQNRMLNFLENHDELRISSDFFLKNPYLAIPAVAISLLLNTAPFMLYFGQELGEKGMDHEGYSSLDGKTSIFDYWSLESLNRWRKSKDEPEIRAKYRKLLNLSVNEPAFRTGRTYDLAYVNPESTFFNPFYHYAFLRFYKGEMIIVVANFESNKRTLKINLPKHCFDYFEVKDQFVDFGIDLISSCRVSELLSFRTPYTVEVDGNDIRIIKFLLQ